MTTSAASPTTGIRAAQCVLPCDELDPMLAFFRDRLGFRLTTIYPADDPAVAILSGYGLTLRVERDAGRTPDAGTVRLLCDDPDRVADGGRELTAPNGTRVQLVDADPPLQLPPLQPSLVISRLGADAEWVQGRAGMQYRDLVPDRQGGRYIASHIRILDGGPVPDYVHFHRVRFQMIFCYRGWVRVAYEDQGPPFVLEPGDCVLQAPQIRHRVLECSPGLEVIELGCPADHETGVDHDLELPTDVVRPDRDFGGQRFVRHIAAQTEWSPWRIRGFEARDTGIAAASNGVAGSVVARPVAGSTPTASESVRHDAEFHFTFVLEGGATFRCEGRDDQPLTAGDSVVVPAGLAHSWADISPQLELLEVALPAGYSTKPAG